MLKEHITNFIQYQENFKEGSDKTITSYKIDLLQFNSFINRNKGIKSIEDITQYHIEDFIASLKGRKGRTLASISTKNRKIASIKSFFRYLEGRVIYKNPSLKIQTIKKKKKQPKYLEKSEAIELLNVIDDTRDLAIFKTFLLTGVRISELVGMNVSDIKNGNALLVRGKGSKERYVQLPQTLIESVNDWLNIKPDVTEEDGKVPMFTSNQNKRISTHAIQKNLKKYLDKADLSNKGITVHKLRHSAATLMYEGGAGVLELKNILGHESIETTQIYTHTNNKNQRDAINSSTLNQALMEV